MAFNSRTLNRPCHLVLIKYHVWTRHQLVSGRHMYFYQLSSKTCRTPAGFSLIPGWVELFAKPKYETSFSSNSWSLKYQALRRLRR